MTERQEIKFDPTHVIQEAIDTNRIRELYKPLEALFNLRRSLLLEQPPSPIEILDTENAIGEICYYLGEWEGIGHVAGVLWLRGVVDTRGEVLRIASCAYDERDRKSEKGLSDVPIVGIVGQIASGKGMFGNTCSERYDSMHLPLSDRLREYAMAQGNFLPQFRETLRSIDGTLKPRFGKPVFVEWTLEKAQRLAKQYVLPFVTIDGFRSVEEAIEFVEKGGILIGITADTELRYQRLLQRVRPGDDFSREKFDISDEIESGWINPIFKLCQTGISNNGTLEDFQLAVIQTIESLHLNTQ